MGLRDCELTGRVPPHTYDMGFKRGSTPALWEQRAAVDEFNRQLVCNPNPNPNHTDDMGFKGAAVDEFNRHLVCAAWVRVRVSVGVW